MDYDCIYNLKSKPSAVDYKSRFGHSFTTRYKKTYLEEYRQGLLSSLTSSPNRKNSKKNEKSILCLQDYSLPSTTFCSSLASLPKKSSIFPVPFSPSKPKDFHSINKHNSPSIPSKSICEIISLNALGSATRLIREDGLKTATRAYSRQLKQFCIEVLANIKD